MRAPLLLAVVAALVTSWCPRTARADGPNAQQADKLFQEGMALLEKGNPGAACPKLEESFKLDPAIGTQFRLADCLERQGRLAAAREVFIEVADQSKRFGDAGKETTARARASALEPRLGRLVVEAPASPPAELLVSIGGVPLDKSAWGRERWFDPAPALKIRAQAAGFVPVEVEVAVEAGKVTKASIPALERAVLGKPDAKPDTRPDQKDAVPARDGAGQRVAGAVVGGVGVVALGVAIGFGVVAKDTYDAALKDECGGDPNACSAAGRTKGQNAFTQSYVSTGMFVGGGVAIGVGLVVLLTAPSAPKKQARIPLVVPAIGKDSAGLSVLGAF